MQFCLASIARAISCIVALALLLSSGYSSLVVAQETASGLAGEFAVTIAAEDVPPELIGGAMLVGRWRIAFGDDGGYVLNRQDVGNLVHGQYEAIGERLFLRDEVGITACEPGSDNGAEAEYEWRVAEGRLLLTAVVEPCARRRLLLTTRMLTPFVSCPPLAIAADSGAARATPVSATPTPPAILATEIDMLLRQMSECWATRQPERFLSLLSARYREELRPQSDRDERRFTLNMGAPIVWDLAGEVNLESPLRATAPVRQTLGDNVDAVHYAFIFEGNAWRWDGVAEE